MAGRVSSPRFIGREQELTQLGAALGGAAAGEAALVVVTGETGVGKTRLVGEFGARARRDGAHVLVGGCIPLDEGALPWGPVVEALRELTQRLDPATLGRLVGPARAELGRLLPELALTAGPSEAPASPRSQARLFELLLGVLARLGQDAPVVLVLEDVHWADRSTRGLVGFLSHAIGHERLLVLVTYRDDELRRGHPLRPVLGELARSSRVGRVELARFGRAELVAQLTAILGAVPGRALAEEVFIRSDGNAFYAEELLASTPRWRGAAAAGLAARHAAGAAGPAA
jgi:predicted ATPase